MATEDKISIAFAYDGENEDVPFSFETTEEALTRLGGEAGSSSSSAGAGGGDGEEGEGGGGTLFTPLTSGSWSSDSAFTLDPGSVLDCWSVEITQPTAFTHTHTSTHIPFVAVMFNDTTSLQPYTPSSLNSPRYPELCAHVAAIVTAGTTALPLPLHVEGDDLSVALSFFCVDHNPAAFTFEGSDKVLRRVRHASWLKARGAVDEATEFIATKMDETTVGVNGFSVGPISFYYNRTSFAQDGIAATSNMHQLSGETLFLAFDGR